MEQQKREGKTMTAEKIIDSLKFTFEEAGEQKDLFTPSHVLYVPHYQPGKQPPLYF